MTDDLYAALEVSPSASLAEIRAAFRRLARAHHPDLGARSTERMVALNRAYAVLSDPQRRRAYDARRASPSSASTAPVEDEIRADDPPWLIDLERGHDLDDWRQMYAEERHAWEQLMRSRDPPDPAIQHALDRSKRDQLELENAIRARHGLPPLTVADLQPRPTPGADARAAGCTLLALSLLVSYVLLVSYLRSKSSTRRSGSGTTTCRP